jgi:hypothetical protein
MVCTESEILMFKQAPVPYPQVLASYPYFFTQEHDQKMLAGGGDLICIQERGGAHVRIHHYEQVPCQYSSHLSITAAHRNKAMKCAPFYKLNFTRINSTVTLVIRSL